MKQKYLFYTCGIVMSLMLGGCGENSSGNAGDSTQYIESSAESESAGTAEEATGAEESSASEDGAADTEASFVLPVSPLENTVYTPQNMQEISDSMVLAIDEWTNNIIFDMSSMEVSDNEQEMTIRNAFYRVQADRPDLKYVYDIELEQQDAGILCSILYMPYKLGTIDKSNLPEGTVAIENLLDLAEAANDVLGEESIPIAILNRNLDVDDMNRALGQAGYSYLYFSLNKDATQIVAMPTNGRTMEECMQYIADTKALAEQIAGEIITDGMTDEEKIAAIYQYVTENVVYDMRYYEAPATMPYESTTAYGALKDNLAICGGYSWAVKMLAEQVGIDVYVVPGNASGENHMWNLAKYNGSYCFFDATYDRGREGNYAFFAKTKEDFKGRTWNKDFVDKLINTK